MGIRKVASEGFGAALPGALPSRGTTARELTGTTGGLEGAVVFGSVVSI